MMRFALDAIFSFSVVPLRIATISGIFITGLSLLVILRSLYLRFVLNTVIPGFTAIFVAVLFIGGLNLLLTGILGEYISRIYVEAKARPLYLVQEFVSAPSRES